MTPAQEVALLDRIQKAEGIASDLRAELRTISEMLLQGVERRATDPAPPKARAGPPPLPPPPPSSKKNRDEP